jgi:rhodanese-related sulfurtransferase
MMPEMIPELSVQELAGEIQSGRSLTLLDVREPEELAHGFIDGAVFIPMMELPDRLHELEPGASIIAICRTGGRSGRAAEFLLAQGFADVWNLAGGMNAWALEIDPACRPY